jgi:hypothetical protein
VLTTLYLIRYKVVNSCAVNRLFLASLQEPRKQNPEKSNCYRNSAVFHRSCAFVFEVEIAKTAAFAASDANPSMERL